MLHTYKALSMNDDFTASTPKGIDPKLFAAMLARSGSKLAQPISNHQSTDNASPANKTPRTSITNSTSSNVISASSNKNTQNKLPTTTELSSSPQPALSPVSTSSDTNSFSNQPTDGFSQLLLPTIQNTAPSSPGTDKILHGLNSAQHEAVTHTGSPLLVMAGAGSGKTRVLTHRIAYLIATGHTTPAKVLAITFTNKAANEMRTRLNNLLGKTAQYMWVMTFHAACLRILRQQHEVANLKANFTIYDTADSQRIMKIIITEINLDSEKYKPKSLCAKISDYKNSLISPQEALELAGSDPNSKVWAQSYQRYQQKLQQAQALDFDDIVMRTVELLQKHDDVRSHYQQRFSQILIDEYQDTNHAQYVLVSLLANNNGQGITVVGDSDQSIYGFRGANIRNIEEFEKDFPGAHTILLEQNYRSTQNILSAANAVIAGNANRRAKNLWTEGATGSKITVYTADDEQDEARFVAQNIQDLRNQTHKSYQYKDMAVFYRTNAQSWALEERFVRMGVPYLVVGGTKFYDRREIKDALAYLRAAVNPDDTVSIRRVLNVPKRGLGQKTEDTLANYASEHHISFGQALALACDPDDSPITGIGLKARTQLSEFWGIIEKMRELDQVCTPVVEILDYALTASGYKASLQNSQDIQDQTRLEYINELKAVALSSQTEFEKALTDTREALELSKNSTETPDEVLLLSELELNDHYGIADFIEKIALVSDSDQISDAEGEGQVTLMTIHTAKGIEFPNVFVTGLEDGTFPHQRALFDEPELEEERRLAYVALTRARENLYLSHALTRTQWGASHNFLPSRFLEDIPKEIINYIYSSNARYNNFFADMQSSPDNDVFADFSSHHTSYSYTDYNDTDFAPAIGSRKSTSSTYRSSKVQVSYTRPHKNAVSKHTTARLDSSKPSKHANTTLERLDGSAKQSSAQNNNTTPILVPKIGQRISHSIYGIGTVEALEGAGRSLVAKIKFGEGTKRILLRLAKIELLD